ncbi:hypothetical protein RCIP0023_00250 [Klebsiella phage RCIP0023]
MFYLGTVKKNSNVIEASLICTNNEVAGYAFAQDRFMKHYTGDNSVSFDFERIGDGVTIMKFEDLPEIDFDFVVTL